MSAIVTQEDVTAALSAARGTVPGIDGADVQPGPAAIASPSYRGLESAAFLIGTQDAGAHFLKIMHPEMRPFFDLSSALAVAVAAGDAGITPRVLWSDEATGAVLSEAAGDGWHEATLYDLGRPAVIGGAMRALQKLHALPATGARFDAFARLSHNLDLARTLSVGLPEDMGWIMALLGLARPALEGGPLVPCRNDGSASNVLVGPDQSVLLVDFDRAGMNDPLYDVGALLSEMTAFEPEMREAFITYLGAWDEVAFARARLWSVVDDVLHAVEARIAGHLSVRRHLEWLKYGEWRLMRARLALVHPQFEERVRRVEGGK